MLGPQVDGEESPGAEERVQQLVQHPRREHRGEPRPLLAGAPGEHRVDRDDLRRALDGTGEGALDRACELDSLERVQQRVDGWLTALVDELTRSRHAAHYGDGVPA